MFTVECNVGRLVEVRVASLRTMAEFDQYCADLRACCERVPGRLVGCADIRRVQLFPPDVADALIGLLTSVNTKFERSAILLPAQAPTFAMQMERLVRQSKSAARKTFRDGGAAARWLSEILSRAEAARLDDFVKQG